MTTYSMTGFGRAKRAPFTVEVQSINGKNLTTKVYLPSELRSLEIEIIRFLETKLKRGTVTIKVEANFQETSPLSIQPNLLLAEEIKRAATRLSAASGVPLEPLLLELLLQQKEILQFTVVTEIEEKMKSSLFETLSSALDELLTMRAFEGKILVEECLKRLAHIETLAHQVAKETENLPKLIFERLTARLDEILRPGVSQEAVEREVALLADKRDVKEELARLQSHIDHFREVIRKGGPVGKTLDFIIQEIFREINTLGTKGTEAHISRSIVEMKSEIERIREQVQNVE